MRPSFFHHLHPPTIPALQARFRYTLGAGGIAVFLILVLAVTGVLEMFYYIPTNEQAADSVQIIAFLVPYGWLIRNIHYWAAQLLVVVSLIHMLRVIFTGAYSKHRRLNYLLGLILLMMILFLDFTGYVLRWDSGIYWALTTGTNLVKSIPVVGTNAYEMIVGGREIGSPTLIRFYTWHILGLAIILVVIGVWHLFRVRRDGGIAIPPPGLRSDHSRIERSELLRREIMAGFLTGAALIVLSILRPAPIAPSITETTLLNADARAPWFFLWVQQLLRLGDPFFWGVLIPLAVLVWFALIPYLFAQARPEELGKWFPQGNRTAWISALIITIFILGLTIWAILMN